VSTDDRDRPKGVKDLMAVTGLCRPTVCAAIRTGELPGYKVGERYVIPHQAFEDFIHGRWIPMHRHIFSEPIRPLHSDALITHRTSRKDTPS